MRQTENWVAHHLAKYAIFVDDVDVWMEVVQIL